jgi:hypothetical protein
MWAPDGHMTRVAHTWRRFLSAYMRPSGSAGRRHTKQQHVCVTAASPPDVRKGCAFPADMRLEQCPSRRLEG